MSYFSPRIDDGADSSTSHLATASHPPRAWLTVYLPDRGRDLADATLRISSSVTGSRTAILLYLHLQTNRHVWATKI